MREYKMTDQTMQGYYQDTQALLFRKIKESVSSIKLTKVLSPLFLSKEVARDRLHRSPQHPDVQVSNSVPSSFFYDVDEVIGK